MQDSFSPNFRHQKTNTPKNYVIQINKRSAEHTRLIGRAPLSPRAFWLSRVGRSHRLTTSASCCVDVAVVENNMRSSGSGTASAKSR